MSSRSSTIFSPIRSAFVNACIEKGTLLTGPLLLLQGRQVRRTTQRLPEPPGERSGSFGEGSPLKLLVLGDSAAAGVGASCLDDSLLGFLLQHLGKKRLVEFRLIARTGATSASTLRYLRKLCAESKGLECDLVVTSLGVNDVMHGVSAKEFVAAQTEIIALLQKQLGAAEIVLTGVPALGRFPPFPQPLRAHLGAKAQRFNHQLQHLIRAQKGCAFLDLAAFHDSEKMAEDGFHPSPAAYAIWAEEAVNLLPIGCEQ